MKLSESMRLAAKLIDAFPHVRLDDESAQRTLKIYAEYLQDLDFGEAEAAVSGLLATARFFPTIAEIRGAVAEAALDAPSAEEAWAIVQREIRRVGSWGKPEFGDPRIAATVAGLGWRALCASDARLQVPESFMERITTEDAVGGVAFNPVTQG